MLLSYTIVHEYISLHKIKVLKVPDAHSLVNTQARSQREHDPSFTILNECSFKAKHY